MARRMPKHASGTPKRPDPRGSSAQRGYGYRWRKLRAAILAGEPLCRLCAERGLTVPATDVDHIVPKAPGEPGQCVTAEELMPLCHACHSRKTSTQDQGFGRAPKE
jgi:5-methylcytosine-specific restriction protein A